MSFDSHNPFGLAALDYFNGDKSVTFIVHDELGQKHLRPFSLFFREPDEFPVWEKQALALCRGRILDIGAGVGRHSLALQERGFSVCAVEVVPQCVEIMKKRGVKEAHCVDIFTFQAEEPFDTILCIMNGVIIAKDLAGLQPFLTHLRKLTKVGGQLLIDSTDLHKLPELRSLLEAKAGNGRYIGEMEVQIEYKGIKGKPFKELYIEPEILGEIALKSGWTYQILFREENGRYLAQLTRNE